MQPLSPALALKTRKRWDRTDSVAFMIGATGIFITFIVSSSVLVAAVATGVVLIVNAAIWVLV